MSILRDTSTAQTIKHKQKSMGGRGVKSSHWNMYISSAFCGEDRPQTSPAPLFFYSRDFGGDGGGESEMRCLNTPLPSSLHPTPPHTWDGHFISECSKWKGDLNLPCFPLNPPRPRPPSPTHRASYHWWTAHCWLPKPAVSTPNSVIENTGYTLFRFFAVLRC